MSQISREERSFTAAFMAAVKGNHSLMFAAFAGRKINLHSKTKLSGRNLLHAAVSGGSTSCVANILMNGGNALLEAPDNTGETPVKMAKKLYGEDGDMVKFLNVYLELHRREIKHSGFSNRYWDNLEKNNNSSDVISVDNEDNNGDENRSQSDEKLITELGDLNLDQDDLSRTNFTETEFFTSESNKSFPSVSKVNIENYDAKTGYNSSVVTSNGSSKPDGHLENNVNPVNLSCSEQSYGQTSDTGYFSSGNQSNGKDVTEMFWNEDLFTQTNVPSTESQITKQELNLDEQTGADDDEEGATNLTILSAVSSAVESSRWIKPRRRAQLRFLEQKRKRSTTERPNSEQLMMMGSDSVPSESRENGQNEEHTNEGGDKRQTTESREKENPAITADDVIKVWQGQDNVPTVTISTNRDSSADNCHSSKPLRRAQLRKKSIVEQRRKRSMVERPKVEELDTGERKSEGRTSDNLERNPEETTSGVFEQTAEGNKGEKLKRTAEDTTSGILQHNLKNSTTDLERDNDTNSKLEQRTEGFKTNESLEDESPVSAKYVLRLWQNQAHDAEMAALSGDESETGRRSPKLQRRAFMRKQVFMEQRRKKSATERPNIIKLIRRSEVEDENAIQDANENASENNRKDKPSVAGNDVSSLPVSQENAPSYIPAVTAGDESSMKVQFWDDKETSEPVSHLPPKSQTTERIPLRRAQRCSSTGPLLDSPEKKGARPTSWSSVSGDESEASDQEKKVVAETVTSIGRLTKAQRRRRLPLLPDKGIKLPVIKVEDSGNSRGSAANKAPHPPLGRTRSGSTCSEDSVSSVEMSSGKASEGESVSSPTMMTNIGATKCLPVKQRRKSVPNSPFIFSQPITRSRRDSIQVEEIEEQGLGISPQLRARLQLRDKPRERLPWNEWKTRIRSGSLPGKSDQNSAEQFMKHKELQQNSVRLDAWNEKKPRPKTARHGNSRMSFTEWLENKEGSERTRPMTTRVRSDQEHKDDDDQERHLHASKKFEEWLLKKDLDALEQEEKLRRKAKIKFKRAYKYI